MGGINLSLPAVNVIVALIENAKRYRLGSELPSIAEKTTFFAQDAEKMCYEDRLLKCPPPRAKRGRRVLSTLPSLHRATVHSDVSRFSGKIFTATIAKMLSSRVSSNFLKTGVPPITEKHAGFSEASN
jgi:hypothetical protein